MDTVKLFEEDVRARRRLAEPDIHLAIINAVLRDIAAKSGVEKLGEEFRGKNLYYDGFVRIGAEFA